MENYINPFKLKRLDNKHSQKHVAKILGISTQYYGKLERNPDDFKLAQLKILAELWECDLNAFADEEFTNSITKKDLKQLINRLIDEL